MTMSHFYASDSMLLSSDGESVSKLPAGLELMARSQELLEYLRRVEGELDGLAVEKAKLMIRVGRPLQELAGFLLQRLAKRPMHTIFSEHDQLLRDILLLNKHNESGATLLHLRAEMETTALEQRQKRLIEQHKKCLHQLTEVVMHMLQPEPPDQLYEAILERHPELGGPYGLFRDVHAHAIGEEMVPTTPPESDGLSISSMQLLGTPDPEQWDPIYGDQWKDTSMESI